MLWIEHVPRHPHCKQSQGNCQRHPEQNSLVRFDLEVAQEIEAHEEAGRGPCDVGRVADLWTEGAVVSV